MVYFPTHERMKMGLLLISCLIATASASCNVAIQLSSHSTIITSPGFPSNYAKDVNCWWSLTTMYKDSSITFVMEVLDMEPAGKCDYDSLTVHDGPDTSSPSIGKYCMQNQTQTLHSTGESMHLLFQSDGSNEFKGFSVQAYENFSVDRAKILLRNTVKLDCTSSGWLVKLNTTKLASIFHDMNKYNIYMSNQFCSGHMQGDILVFNSSFAGCNTGVEESPNSVIMSNYLIEYIRDDQTKLVIGSKWKYDLSCYLHKNETDHLSFVPVDNNTLSAQTTGQVSTNQAVIKFFSDPGFAHPMTANPLKVSLGSRVYVQVEAHLPDNIKLILNSCDVTGELNDVNSTSVDLINNRCEANHFTHILGSIPRLARFYFDVFEVHHPHENLYVNCDITFCPIMDFSPQCQNTCQRTNP